MSDENEVLKKLLIDETDMLKDLEQLIEKAKNIFVIEKSTGNIVIKKTDFSDPKRICVLLMGKYFAKKLGLISSGALSSAEIAKELGRPITSISGPIKDLKTKSYIQKIDNKYEIVYPQLNNILTNYLGDQNSGR